MLTKCLIKGIRFAVAEKKITKPRLSPNANGEFQLFFVCIVDRGEIEQDFLLLLISAIRPDCNKT